LPARPSINFSDAGVLPRPNLGIEDAFEEIGRGIVRFLDDINEDGEAIPIPRVRPNDSPSNCGNTFPNQITCDSLSGGYRYATEQQALRVLKEEYGINQLSLQNRAVTHSGPCPNRGTHFNVKYQGNHYGSIVCCPCCEETIVGPNITQRCNIIR